jgi:hypothetical protein
VEGSRSRDGEGAVRKCVLRGASLRSAVAYGSFVRCCALAPKTTAKQSRLRKNRGSQIVAGSKPATGGIEGAEKGLDSAHPEHRLKSVPPIFGSLSAHGGTGFSLWKPFSATSRLPAPQDVSCDRREWGRLKLPGIPAEKRKQEPGVYRFGHIIIHARGETTLAITAQSVGGHRNDRNVRA